MKLSVLLPTFLGAAALPLAAATAPIGIASAVASYTLNDAAQVGANSIADGTSVSTSTAPTDIRLDNGAQVRLATRSTGTVYNDHLALTSGAVRVGEFTDYPVRVHNLQITADTPDARAIIRVQQRTVEVASLGGSISVSDGGAMMTRVAAGTKAAFRPQATSSTTGAAPANIPDEQERDTLFWTFIGVSAAAATIGTIAAVQGKSPF